MKAKLLSLASNLVDLYIDAAPQILPFFIAGVAFGGVTIVSMLAGLGLMVAYNVGRRTLPELTE